MSSSDLQKKWASSYLSGGNMAYVDSLYEDYLTDPGSVSSDWRAVFSALPKVNGAEKEPSHREIRDYFLKNADKRALPVVQSSDSQQFRIADLINAYRALGHHAARLDPLEMTERAPIPALELEHHHLSDADSAVA